MREGVPRLLKLRLGALLRVSARWRSVRSSTKATPWFSPSKLAAPTSVENGAIEVPNENPDDIRIHRSRRSSASRGRLSRQPSRSPRESSSKSPRHSPRRRSLQRSLSLAAVPAVELQNDPYVNCKLVHHPLNSSVEVFIRNRTHWFPGSGDLRLSGRYHEVQRSETRRPDARPCWQ